MLESGKPFGMEDEGEIREEFLWSAILDSMRKGNLPDETSANELNRIPLINRLRKQVRDNDKDWLLNLSETGPVPAAGLAASLLRAFSHEKDVSVRLQHLWETHQDVYLRCLLVWRILDYPELEGKVWNEKLFAFLMNNWSVVQGQVSQYWGTPEGVIPWVLTRLADPTFPVTKKWAYLISLPETAKDQAAAKALL